jgi:DNA-binding response OmpR family regulator
MALHGGSIEAHSPPIDLPGIDGCEVARRLRAGASTSGLRLIALTGHGRESDTVLAREAGSDGHPVKPVDLEDLERIMAVPAE